MREFSNYNRIKVKDGFILMPMLTSRYISLLAILLLVLFFAPSTSFLAKAQKKPESESVVTVIVRPTVSPPPTLFILPSKKPQVIEGVKGSPENVAAFLRNLKLQFRVSSSPSSVYERPGEGPTAAVEISAIISREHDDRSAEETITHQGKKDVKISTRKPVRAGFVWDIDNDEAKGRKIVVAKISARTNKPLTITWSPMALSAGMSIFKSEFSGVYWDRENGYFRVSPGWEEFLPDKPGDKTNRTNKELLSLACNRAHAAAEQQGGINCTTRLSSDCHDHYTQEPLDLNKTVQSGISVCVCMVDCDSSSF